MRKEERLMNWKRISLALIVTAMTTSLWIGTSARSTQKNDKDERAEDKKLPGTWNVTLRFPTCTVTCTCPGGVPNVPIPSLNTYLKDETLLVSLGGSLFAGPGYGSWERSEHNHFSARFKFFLFTPTGMLRGSEEVTKDIRVTGPDAFEATSTFVVFDPAGNITAQGCIINETATRFE